MSPLMYVFDCSLCSLDGRTSRFLKDAENIISRSHKSIVLIDGPKLVKLIIDFNIGVSTIKSYQIKKIDTDFFTDE